MTLNALRAFAFLLLLACFSSYASAMSSNFDGPLSFLTGLHNDWFMTHQAKPMGVPQDYSWYAKPQVEAGNRPGRFKTITGWGHAFWSKGTLGHPGQLQIRNFQTFICSGADRRWERIQSGMLEGAEYRADFKNNAAKKARYTSDGIVTTVTFDAGNTFHFWPKGRVTLPSADICGVVVLLEARTVPLAQGEAPSVSGGYLIGVGADYWIDSSAAWDNFKTNKGVGLGRLKTVSPQWAWFGMSTAPENELLRLHTSGLLRLAH